VPDTFSPLQQRGIVVCAALQAWQNLPRPTLLDYLGVDAPPDRHRVGRSYAPLPQGKALGEREELYFECEYVRAVRRKRWKYIQHVEGWPSKRSIREFGIWRNCTTFGRIPSRGTTCWGMFPTG